MIEPPCKKICLDNSSSLDEPAYIDQYKNVGIEEFLFNDGEGFSGQIKERWEDFIVNEVDLIGNEVIYKGDNLPKDEEILISKYENKHLSEEVVNRLIKCSESQENMEVSFNASDDKEVRSDIYKYIKTNYKNLYGNTEERDNQKMFVITNFTDERTKVANRIAKKSGKDEYCQFALYKEGKDTMSALAIIAKYLHMNPALFTYAGTKDKRGITTQLVTVKGCSAERLKGLNKCLRGLALGNFTYVNKPLKLGDLYGNRFKLVIRNVDGTDEQIESAVERFKKGFINYFGLQRFGSTETRSHDIGMLAIGSKWEEMIKAILEPTPQDLPLMRDCKEKFKESGDCKEFINNAPLSIEKSIVQGVSVHGYTLNALDKLPRNLRQLYVHSFQSYIWNMMASRRIREFGNDKVLDGDLIIAGDDTEVTLATEGGSHTLSSVVLPLPGYDVRLPDNEQGQWYEEALARHGLDLARLRHRVREFSLPGAYRSIVAVPQDVSHHVHRYEDAAAPLIETDLQRVRGGFNLPPSSGSKTAVVMEFTLPKSSYATIAIRELLKTIKVFQ